MINEAEIKEKLQNLSLKEYGDCLVEIKYFPTHHIEILDSTPDHLILKVATFTSQAQTLYLNIEHNKDKSVELIKKAFKDFVIYFPYFHYVPAPIKEEGENLVKTQKVINEWVHNNLNIQVTCNLFGDLTHLHPHSQVKGEIIAVITKM